VVTAAALKAPERGAPDGLLLVLHDVTRLRELESVRREFVANVSHEFRTPLSVINGYLETLEQGEVGKEMLLKSVAVMQRHCTRLNRLIEDLLTISRMEEKGVVLETTPSDLGNILRDVVQQTERDICQRGVEVTLSLPEALPRLELDVHRIEQAFSNLLANALRHGAQEGGRVAISANQEGSEIRISFSDNGPGIPLQDQRHLFERFYRVGGDRARQTGGTGLGLSIVKNVVLAHGGRVTLESKPGEGSTFSIFLRVSR
jgi:two-component system phosphate regulon sensor histidine kinase PhoR